MRRRGDGYRRRQASAAIGGSRVDAPPRGLVDLQVRRPDPVHNPSVLDPTSTSRNFETIGKTAYLYYTQFHTQNCQQGPDRDLVRVPITVSG
jgi:hypothetical protein